MKGILWECRPGPEVAKCVKDEIKGEVLLKNVIENVQKFSIV